MIAREKVSLPRFWRGLAIAVLVLVGIAGVWLVGEHSPANLGRATLAIGGAGLVARIWASSLSHEQSSGVLLTPLASGRRLRA